MKNRKRALRWWRSLTEQQQREMAEEHGGEWPFLMVTTSSQKIEEIFNKLHSED